MAKLPLVFGIKQEQNVAALRADSMADAASIDLASESERLDAACDDAIAACGGDLRSTIRALILANEYIEYEMQINVSAGYMRGVRHGRFSTYSG